MGTVLKQKPGAAPGCAPSFQKTRIAWGFGHQVSRLAIGVAGGFNPEEDKKYDVVEETHIVQWISEDQQEVQEIDDDRVPLGVSLAAKAILQAQSATRKAEVMEHSSLRCYSFYH